MNDCGGMPIKTIGHMWLSWKCACGASVKAGENHELTHECKLPQPWPPSAPICIPSPDVLSS
jgi:hypothetical protein